MKMTAITVKEYALVNPNTHQNTIQGPYELCQKLWLRKS